MATGVWRRRGLPPRPAGDDRLVQRPRQPGPIQDGSVRAVSGVPLARRIVEAVRTVVPAENAAVPLHAPEFRGRERDYLNDCVETGWVSSVGAYVDRFEHDLADLTGAGRA